MKRLALVFLALVAMCSMALPGHAFSKIAGCSGVTGGPDEGCSQVFVATLNLDTVHVRFIPSIDFTGETETQIFEVGNPSNEVHYFSTWVTGKVELDGPLYSDPYKLLAGSTYEVLTVTTSTLPGPLTGGGVEAVVEV